MADSAIRRLLVTLTMRLAATGMGLAGFAIIFGKAMRREAMPQPGTAYLEDPCLGVLR